MENYLLGPVQIHLNLIKSRGLSLKLSREAEGPAVTSTFQGSYQKKQSALPLERDKTGGGRGGKKGAPDKALSQEIWRAEIL